MKKYLIPFLVLLMLAGCSATKINTKTTALSGNFSKDQATYIQKAESDKPMRVFKINSVSDSILLREKSSYINPNDPDVPLFAARLFATVRDSMSLGVGIAAPQVGILKNIIWVQRFDKEDLPFEVYLNPKIIQYSKKKQTRKEGCLSIPDRSETLNSRAYAILIEYDTMDNKHHIEMVEDFTAVIFQHEIDHLDGILYLDHLQQEIEDAKTK
ncbi:MAG: peptide deformylase [Cellulophaga sp.]|nr:peptide deformylase [Cellulophaga sp.]